MKNWMPILENQTLFTGFDSQTISRLLEQADARLVTVPRGQTAFHFESRPASLCLLLQGYAVATQTTETHRDRIYAQFSPGDLLSVFPQQSAPPQMQILACTELTLLVFSADTLLHTQAIPLETRLLFSQNFASLTARQYAALFDRIRCLTAQTLREKILQYLHAEAERQHSLTFSIPLDRASLAAYLNADRSALSRELSQMKQEGLVDFYKNSFKLTPSHDSERKS